MSKLERILEKDLRDTLMIGDKVKMLAGSRKGDIGIVTGLDIEEDQVDVEFEDGDVRYTSFDTVKVVK